jgi:MYXO-CTERM domain-containing protein
VILPILFAETVRNEGGRIAIRSILAAVALLGSPAGSALAAVAVDRVTPYDSGRYGTSFSFSHTVGTGPSRLLIVAVIDGNRNTSVTSLTFGGAALTRIDRTQGTGVAAELWRLVAPASGTQTIVVNMSSNQDRPIATAISYTGVDQTAPVGMAAGAGGSGTAVSISVPSAPGDHVMDAGSAWVTRNPPNATAGPGQTQRWSLSNGVDTRVMGSDKLATGATTTMAWTVTGMTSWVSIGVAVKPATTTPPPPDAAPPPLDAAAPPADAGVPPRDSGSPPPDAAGRDVASPIDAAPSTDAALTPDARLAGDRSMPADVDGGSSAVAVDLQIGNACAIARRYSSGNRSPTSGVLAVLLVVTAWARRRRHRGHPSSRRPMSRG